MDQYYFDKLVGLMEQVACDFRGWSLTKEQYEKVDELWEMARLCYLPCRPQPESETNKQLSEAILAEIQKEYDQDVVDELAGWTVDFEQQKISPKERGELSFNPELGIYYAKCSDEDVAYWKKYYEENPPNVTAEDILGIIRKKRTKLSAYDNAMKVVK